MDETEQTTENAPEGIDFEQARRECLDELREVCLRRGMIMYARMPITPVPGNRYLIEPVVDVYPKTS